MGQEEVCKVLKKRPRLTARELSDELNKDLAHICKILKDLMKYNEVSTDLTTDKELEKLKKKYGFYNNRTAKIKVYILNKNAY